MTGGSLGGVALLALVQATPVDAEGQVAAAITNAGYNCRKVVYADPVGQDQFGQVIKVWCLGLVPGSTEIVAFRMTLRPNDKVTIAPWR